MIIQQIYYQVIEECRNRMNFGFCRSKKEETKISFTIIMITLQKD